VNSEELEDGVTDSLLNAEPWVGGCPGVTSTLTLTLMESRGLIGSRGGLTRKGALEAARIQAERWGT
jgi:hypothetical protein